MKWQLAKGAAAEQVPTTPAIVLQVVWLVCLLETQTEMLRALLAFPPDTQAKRRPDDVYDYTYS